MSKDVNGASDGPRPRRDADRGREPKLVSGRAGTRLYSQAALLERIIAAFYEEHGIDSPALREADTNARRMRLVLNTAEYVLAVESVVLSLDQKADLVRRAYDELFGYGPLDMYFADEQVTTIVLDGADRVAARYGNGDLVPLGPLFEDEEHLRLMLSRLVRDAGAELRPDVPILETGLTVRERPIALSVAAPPVAATLAVNIRLHLPVARTLDALVHDGFLITEAAQFARDLARSPYGLAVVGEPESGKTTLLNALVLELAQPERAISVERAGELRLPPATRRLMTRWPVGDDPGMSFGSQILAALREAPETLILDEARADEPETIGPILERDDAPRQLWSLRGVPDAKRLQASLGMLARRALPGRGEAPVHALYRRLPFILTVARIRDRLQLFSIAEWQPNPDSEYPDYVLLYQYRDGAARPTIRRPSRPVPSA